jgi:hypothetical protein
VTMSMRTRAGRAPVAIMTVICFAACTAAPPAAAQSPAPAPAAPAKPAAAPAAAPADGPPVATSDQGWPREYPASSGATIVVHQPQVASWNDQKAVVAYSAVSYEGKGNAKPLLGTVKIEAATEVNVERRLVAFTDMRITESNFSGMPKETMADVVAQIDKAIPKEQRVISLDRVLAGLDRSQILPKNIEGVKADPPPIFFSKRPAIVVNLDGEPIWSPIKENDLKFAVNTNWDLFQQGSTQALFLRKDESWLTAPKLEGPWTAVSGKLPESFAKLPAEENFKEVKAAVPGKKLSAKDVPTVFVSQQPAELIMLTGEPAYQAVAGTSLQWVSNTDADVFRMGPTGPVFFLVAGRWFSAPDFTGPWTFATPSLPEEFQKIPLEHPRSAVLASVPGTQQAAEGVLLAQVPQTARVNVRSIQAPEVVYQGEPKFEPIQKTTVSHAVNTDKDIIKVGDLYYMCFEGVWFMSKTATGPWTVTSSVPKAIYEIPPSSSSHNVTYVTVVEDDDDDDEWVAFATVAAYTGVMVAWGCAVWGGGYYYPPYYGYRGGYPYYYGKYPTYGYGAKYNPWTGAYGRGVAAYGPYGGAGYGARYNPRTGTYARGAAAYGPYGSRGYAEAYNPRTGATARTRQGSNVYGNWGASSVQRGGQWAQGAHRTNYATGTTTAGARTSSGAAAVGRTGPGGSAGAVRTRSGDVYAGRDGNVYRNNGGSWQSYNNGQWTGVQPHGGTAGTRSTGTTGRGTVSNPGATGASAATTGATRGTYDRSTTEQLNRDSAARREGSQRTRDYSSYQSSRSSSGGSYSGSSARSYRSSGGSRGGGSRGGGGGRRR